MMTKEFAQHMKSNEQESTTLHSGETRRKYFGTDGIRGRVGVWPITPDFILKLGWAVGTGSGATGFRQGSDWQGYAYSRLYV